jgi:DNA-binding transcriptional MocR family regulator
VSEPLFAWREAILRSELPPTTRLVALVLSTHMDMDGGRCFPSLTRLEDETGLVRSTVAAATKRLEEKEFLYRIRGGPGISTRYRARFPTARQPGAEVVRSSDHLVRPSDHPSPLNGQHSPLVGPELSSTSSSNSSMNSPAGSKQVSSESEEDFEAKKARQRPRMRQEIAKEQAAKKKRGPAEGLVDAVEPLREGADRGPAR